MNTITVKTSYGTLVGQPLEKGAAFLGIPYAEPPLGERRFLPPVPRRRATQEPFIALEPGMAPPQPVRPAPPWASPPPPPTAEDCLNLSVFTPGVDQARRPVLVHLFGGGFEGGSGTGGLQEGAALALKGDYVVVRLNFRVGALGFLYLGEAWGEPYEAGNVALLDVCAALEWVQANIRPLGGDPDNVTLFGLSSGAFMIASLFGVPASRGLFHRAWMQSGSASRILNRAVATRQAAEFLEILGIKPGDRAALEQVEVARIIQAQSQVVAQDVGERNAPGGRTLGVVDDGQTLTEHPLSVLKRGDRKNISILLGTTRDETRLWFAMGLMKEMSLNDLALEFERFAGPVQGPPLLEVYRTLLPQASPAQLRERFLTDAIYRVPAVRTALTHTAVGGQAFVYRFDWTSPVFDGRLGAMHGLDEAFVWGVTDPAQAGLLEDTPETRSIAHEMTTALFQFAASGNPGWPAYAAGEPTTRLFGATGEKLAEVDSAFLEAWNGVARI
jgi:para-nitrobenzyl esterase